MVKLGKISWWQWLPFFSWRVVSVVEAADEIPQRLPRNGAVLVGPQQSPKWMAFDCPCRSGHRVMISLDSNHQPHWIVTEERKLTLMPSINYLGTRRQCHYFIRSGRVLWVNEKG